MDSSRRDFLKQAAGATAACLAGLGTEHSSDAAALAQEAVDAVTVTEGWYSRPMRWAQVAFVEDDPGNYSLPFWLDYFRKIHADAACLTAGGVSAFYPT